MYLPDALPRHTQLSSPAQAGDPVRRGFSVRSLTPLEYWVARSSRAMTVGVWRSLPEAPANHKHVPLPAMSPQGTRLESCCAFFFALACALVSNTLRGTSSVARR